MGRDNGLAYGQAYAGALLWAQGAEGGAGRILEQALQKFLRHPPSVISHKKRHGFRLLFHGHVHGPCAA